ncbi:hypothetical protein Q5P01_000153 [Channa striata]|uniref:Immunoglobulin V-set domain-containing protein n=1 Tax=Channa striata TaxID=64152 RepID=A0AA88ILD2_CHASR|nr:hypothetical protein Q5P01_000153 [Channa striata]
MNWVLLLVDLTFSICGMFPVEISQVFYQTEENNNVTFEWDTQTKSDLSLTNLVCFFHSEPLKVVYHMVNGAEYPQSEQFDGRAQVDRDALIEGQIRLHLSTVTAEDSGNYWCDLAANYDKNKRRWGLEASANFVLNVQQINDGGDSETKPGLKMTTGRAQEQEDSGHFITTIVALFLVLVVVVCFGLIVSGHHRILAARICGDK